MSSGPASTRTPLIIVSPNRHDIRTHSRTRLALQPALGRVNGSAVADAHSASVGAADEVVGHPSIMPKAFAGTGSSAGARPASSDAASTTPRHAARALIESSGTR